MVTSWAASAERDIRVTGLQGVSRELQVELFRKGIHFLIAIVPILAGINIAMTMALLGAGTIIYTYAEHKRSQGFAIAFISAVTSAASRPRDLGKFVLGPVTLGMGAMIALLLYPEPAATVAIYALAFGDGFSSIVGKMFGRVKIPLTGGKTFAGSAACFVVVFGIAYRVSGRISTAIILAVAATLLEALPTGDLDNIILPVGTGFVANQLLMG